MDTGSSLPFIVQAVMDKHREYLILLGQFHAADVPNYLFRAGQHS